MKFMHISDLHLGISIKVRMSDSQKHKNRSLENTERFFEVLKIAASNDVEYLFITGDLFDHPHVPIYFVENVFETLSTLLMEVFITIGNHDTFLHNKTYQSIRDYANIHFFDDAHDVHRFKNIDVYGFSTKNFTESALQTVTENLDNTKQNVLCLHGDIRNAKDDHYLTDLKTLKALTFDYIALGHIHKHEFLDAHIAYAGNLEPFDFSETGSKGYIKGTLAPFKATFYPINKRHYKTLNIKINPQDSLQSIKEKLHKNTTSNERESDFLRVILEGEKDQSLIINRDATLYLSEDFYYLELRDKSQLTLDLKALKKAYKDTIIEILIEDYESHPEDSASLEKALRALLDSEVCL